MRRVTESRIRCAIGSPWFWQVLAMDRGRLNPHDWHAVRVWEPLDCQLGHLKQSVSAVVRTTGLDRC